MMAGLLLAASAAAAGPAAPRRNVLFIVVDNMRPALGAYNNTEVVTPRMDALAKESTLFSRAFCQEAWCSPSRNSFLTGRAPDTTQAWNFEDSFRVVGGGAPGSPPRPGTPGAGASWTTLPGYFLQAGYFAASSGKVFHPDLPRNFDYPRSWSELPVCQDKYSCQSEACPATGKCGMMGCPFAVANASAADAVPVAADADAQCADLTLRTLAGWAATNRSRPFFLAAGFQSPRLPWSFPATVAKTRYPHGASALSIAKLQQPPVPSAAEDLEWFRPVEIDQYSDVQVTHDAPMAVADQQRVRLAYYAGITHVDDQVGRLLDALLSHNAERDTVTVLTADHAQNLGEANMWSMMNLLETSLRVPLMIRPAPSDSTLGAGRSVPVYRQPVELLDLFPTLAALAGLPPPPAEWELPGTDLSEGMRKGVAVKPLNAAFSQITRCVNCTQAYTASGDRGCFADSVDAAKYLVPCAHTPRSQFDYMGMSVRTSDWRYSTFCAWDGATLAADWDRCHGAELYDHRRDTQIYDVDDNGEPFNLAGQAATRGVEEQLHALLRRRFAK